MNAVGSVRVRVQGLSLEKLLGRALEAGIDLRSVERESPRSMLLVVRARDYAALQALCEHVGWRVETVATSASGRAWRMMRRRAMLSVALAVFLLGVWAVNLWVWRVDVRADRATAGAVRTLLEAQSIGVGTRKTALSVESLREELARALTDAAWVDVRVQGVSLVVECAPARLAVPETYGGAVQDIVATRDGVIAQLLVYAGTPQVRVGEAVFQGQVLVKGEERTSGGETKPVAAHAQVMARVWYEGRAVLPAYEESSEPTGRETLVCTLHTPWGSVSWPERPAYEVFDREVTRQPVVGAFVPVTLVKERYIEVRVTRMARDAATLQAEAGAAAEQIALEKAPFDAQIVGKWVDYSMIEGEKICASAVVESVESIGAAQRTAAEAAPEMEDSPIGR